MNAKTSKLIRRYLRVVNRGYAYKQEAKDFKRLTPKQQEARKKVYEDALKQFAPKPYIPLMAAPIRSN